MPEVGGLGEKIQFNPEREGKAAESAVGEVMEERRDALQEESREHLGEYSHESQSPLKRLFGRIFHREKDVQVHPSTLKNAGLGDDHDVETRLDAGIQARLRSIPDATTIPNVASGPLSEAIRNAEDAEGASEELGKVIDFSQARRDRVAANSSVIEASDSEPSKVNEEMGKILTQEGAVRPGIGGEGIEPTNEEEEAFQELRQKSRGERVAIRREEEGKPLVERDTSINKDDKIEKSDQFRRLFFTELRRLRRAEARGNLGESVHSIEILAWNNAKEKYVDDTQELDDEEVENVEEQSKEVNYSDDEMIGKMRVRDTLLREHQKRRAEDRADDGQKELSSEDSGKTDESAEKGVNTKPKDDTREPVRFQKIVRNDSVARSENRDDENDSDDMKKGKDEDDSIVGSRIGKRIKIPRPKLFEKRAA